MLYITLPAAEMYDEATCEFRTVDSLTLQLEHSLVSISKWESKWHKAYLSNKAKSNEELLDYVRCMTVTKNVKPETFLRLTAKDYKTIEKYISEPMTAEWLPEIGEERHNSESITSLLIYYWMVAYNIPFDPCQKWPLSRLLMLIRICNMKNAPKNSRNTADIMRSNAAINAARRKRFHTRG